MVAPATAGPSPNTLGRWQRDYRLSLVIVVAGVVLVVAVTAFSLWANPSGGPLPSFWTGLAVRVLETAGGMLALVGGIFALHNRSLLRQGRRVA